MSDDPAPDAVDGEAADQLAQALALVLDRSPRTLTELADTIGLPAADLRRLLDAPERHGLLAWDADRIGLRPGPAALRFARSGVERADLVELAQPSMLRLAKESGETATLNIALHPSGTEAIAQIDGSHLLGATNWLGRQLGVHCTAAGKVFLAFGAAELPDGELVRLTPHTVTDRQALLNELEEVRQRGYAMMVDELEPGLSAVAAAVRDRRGAVVAALSASGASLRLVPQRLRLLGRVTLEQAHAISTRLGHDGSLDDPVGLRPGDA